jgi:surface polysaccharide O-acyltransferase-like enzyme
MWQMALPYLCFYQNTSHTTTMKSINYWQILEGIEVNVLFFEYLCNQYIRKLHAINMAQENPQYTLFEWLRFPLIVGVVFIHCVGGPIDVESINFSHLSGTDWYDLIRIAFSNVLPRVCVPLFFFISGYLFYTRLSQWDWQVYAEKLKKRAKTILVPYLLWITIAIAYQCTILMVKEGWPAVSSFFAEHGYWHLYWDCYELDPVKLSWTGMEVHSSTPFHYALWYLRDLMIMMLLTPCFHILFKRLKIWGLLLLAVNYVSNIGAFLPELLPTPLLFYGAGVYFQMKNWNLTQCFKRCEWLIHCISFLLFAICLRYNSFYTETGNLFFPFFVMAGSMSVICIATRCIRHNILNSTFIPLSKYSFFIYLSHCVMILPVVLAFIAKIVKPSNPYAMIACYFMAPILTISICLLLAIGIKRTMPKLYNILTGGR